MLFDAVTLRHFACVDRLDILEACYGTRPLPHWTEAVKREVEKHRLRGHRECGRVLEADWLGSAVEASTSDQISVLGILAALTPTAALVGLPQDVRGELTGRNSGEAESIYFATALDGTFVTDDNDAYRVARNRLGRHVLDTVQVLCHAAAMDVVNYGEAAAMAERIRDAGRHLRACYPSPISRAYLSALS